ncbi:hypothetical protein F0P96_13840 [Hymenobacter busanensis]|uniref:Uncharacterized protein n=1 Tax=Hymenobacter busanensis TaxID=2607656 RepID=A0A7L4ZY98_9BACT|nr:hypothetical protein [Hymenobacter busanensis]KAA9331328.1 hypothetical protein F0P96_13840 [Hymenobacter busanensis]QHJ08479.1 hypothetical protein GUY19_14765 [Hymenobacter busanensis]
MKKAIWLLSAAVLGLSACDTTRQQADTASATAEQVRTTAAAATMEKNGIRLTPFTDSPKFPSAGLRLNTPAANSTVPSGPVAFDYDLTNFQLTKMTGHQHGEEMANSMQGQHIHNIVDNEPYTAHYTTEFTKPIADGQHVVLSFLSRSYHESLKHRTAYDLRVISVGKVATPLAVDLAAPHMFYSRPKGEYTGKDAQKVMLDFYLVNTTLTPDGNKVRATINGTEFMLDQWAPYMMEGLPMGQNTVKLELVDGNGNLVPGPYNSVTRTFTLAQ